MNVDMSRREGTGTCTRCGKIMSKTKMDFVQSLKGWYCEDCCEIV
jgi:hypothetical protein